MGAFVGAGRRSLALFERSELASDGRATKKATTVPLLESARASELAGLHDTQLAAINCSPVGTVRPLKLVRRKPLPTRKHQLGALFLVSAWSVQQGISLGQLATEEKSNEITAIPELLDNIDVAGIAQQVLSIDRASWVLEVFKVIQDRNNFLTAQLPDRFALHWRDTIAKQMV